MFCKTLQDINTLCKILKVYSLKKKEFNNKTKQPPLKNKKQQHQKQQYNTKQQHSIFKKNKISTWRLNKYVHAYLLSFVISNVWIYMYQNQFIYFHIYMLQRYVYFNSSSRPISEALFKRTQMS